MILAEHSQGRGTGLCHLEEFPQGCWCVRRLVKQHSDTGKVVPGSLQYSKKATEEIKQSQMARTIKVTIKVSI